MSTPISDRLPRTLGLWSAIALVVGITIGSGIFRSPAAVARNAGSPLAMIGLWLAGGVITLVRRAVVRGAGGRPAARRRAYAHLERCGGCSALLHVNLRLIIWSSRRNSDTATMRRAAGAGFTG